MSETKSSDPYEHHTHDDLVAVIGGLERECERLRGLIIEAASIAYDVGHNDTVESCYGDAREIAEGIADELLSEVYPDRPVPGGE